MRKKLVLSAWIIGILVFCGCGKTQAEQLLESYDALGMAMRMNMDNPEALFQAMDDCIEKYGPVWEANRRILETRSSDSVDRELNLYETDLRASMLEMINLDLEILDRYQDRPDLIKAYQTRVQRIGQIK